ncbi:MAG TPA: sugar phosphate isomerase/epimerase [Pararobbsia sp.]|nr:sugar phosphate isomerase/epimerase [Pararobbsia sp.]
MTPGIFARTYAARFPGDLFTQIRRDGFTAVQFNLSCAGLASLPADLPDGVGEAIANGARDAGVTICALSGTYNMAHPDAAHRKRDRPGFLNVLQAARAMNVKLVTLCTGSRNPANMWAAHPDNTSSAAWAALLEELEFAVPAAQALGLQLGIEPEPGNVIADATLAREVLDEIGSPTLGIVLDAANLLPPEVHDRQADVVAQATDLLAQDLLLVHAKDVDNRGVHVPAGKGAVDLRAFVARVRGAGYDGPLVAHNFDEADAPYVASYLAQLIEAPSR